MCVRVYIYVYVYVVVVTVGVRLLRAPPAVSYSSHDNFLRVMILSFLRKKRSSIFAVEFYLLEGGIKW